MKNPAPWALSQTLCAPSCWHPPHFSLGVTALGLWWHGVCPGGGGPGTVAELPVAEHLHCYVEVLGSNSDDSTCSAASCCRACGAVDDGSRAWVAVPHMRPGRRVLCSWVCVCLPHKSQSFPFDSDLSSSARLLGASLQEQLSAFPSFESAGRLCHTPTCTPAPHSSRLPRSAAMSEAG